MNILTLVGDYQYRQLTANKHKADLYLELHLNAADTPDATGVETWIGTNGSDTSKRIATNIGCYLAARTGLALRNNGIPKVGGRAEGSVVYTAMPAALLEIGFCSNPRDLAKVQCNVNEIADCILNAIEFSIPGGINLLALSVGHVGKSGNRADRGAALVGTSGYEADITLQIASRLVNMTADPHARLS